MAESGFEVEGTTYPIPTFETFSMDEAQVLYDYSGLAVEDFASAHPQASKEEIDAHENMILGKAKNPAFKKALLHIAYARGNPDESYSRVKEIVGQANMIDITMGLVGEADAGPPEMTDSPSELESESDSSPLSKSLDSGSPSTNGSDEPAEHPAPTGTSELDTSSRLSVLTT